MKCIVLLSIPQIAYHIRGHAGCGILGVIFQRILPPCSQEQMDIVSHEYQKVHCCTHLNIRTEHELTVVQNLQVVTPSFFPFKHGSQKQLNSWESEIHASLLLFPQTSASTVPSALSCPSSGPQPLPQTNTHYYFLHSLMYTPFLSLRYPFS